MTKLYTNTVSKTLWQVLTKLMKMEVFNDFRLVGGTALSLQLGHRVSVDIDLFTDVLYGSINFEDIDQILTSTFTHVEMGFGGNNSMGKSYFVGETAEDLVKLDLFYTDSFVFPPLEIQGVRMSCAREIAAMKLEVIGQAGRKKDFWDLHELLEEFNINQMLAFYKIRYPFGHSEKEILENLIYFVQAEDDFEPICLKRKYWELIKLDFQQIASSQ